MLTVKSDDVKGRSKVYEAIVKGENLPDGDVPESFKVLLRELMGLIVKYIWIITVNTESEENPCLLQKQTLTNDFSSIGISLASAETILSRSHGKFLETINYRTFKPEMDGLFCEKIFGPVKDYECHCGKYKHSIQRYYL